MNDEQIKEKIEKTLTGNRLKDRRFLILEWQALSISSSLLSDGLLQYVENQIDEVLPLNINRFTKDMELNPDLWVTYLLHRAGQYTSGYPLEKAFKLCRLAVNELESHNPRINDQKMQYFAVEDPYEETLIKSVLNAPGPFQVIDLPFAEAYYLLAEILFAMGDEIQAVNFLGLANNWNPVSVPILMRISEFFKEKKIVDKLMMVGKFAASIVTDQDMLGVIIRFVGYAYYLDGKYPQAYACYHESLRYGKAGKGVSAEIDAILAAMDKTEVYTPKKKEIKDLFLGDKFFPGPSSMAFDALKNTIRRLFDEKEYSLVIDYADEYLKTKSDAMVLKLRRLALEHLA
ncbi:MAG TPA: hypothetical protein PKC96_06545 [Bacilli bacterium]|nr:hypothetical protein [Bacilli bacterium]